MNVEKSKRTSGTTAKSSAVDEKYDAPFKGYINVNLSDEQKATFEQWFASQVFWDTLDFCVADGVNIAVKVDPKGSGFLASATQRRGTSPNAGLVVTARGREAHVAWGRVVFILAILSRAERWEDIQPMADPDRW